MECLNINDPSTIYERSDNIAIPKKASFENFEELNEYKLTSNNFDPTKASPPNKWNIRLQQRIDNYFNSKNLSPRSPSSHTSHTSHSSHTSPSSHFIPYSEVSKISFTVPI